MGWGDVTLDRHVSPWLSDLKPSWLFEGLQMGLDPEHGKYLKVLFYLHFGQRRIGCIEPQRFRNWVHARFFEVWTLRYKPLYESALKIKDPFLTYGGAMDVGIEHSGEEKLAKITSGNHSTQTNLNHSDQHQNKMEHQRSELSYAFSTGQGQTQEQAESTGNTRDRNAQVRDNMFTETPETRSLEQTIADAFPNSVWNNGKLTNATRDLDQTLADTYSHDGETSLANTQSNQNTGSGGHQGQVSEHGHVASGNRQTYEVSQRDGMEQETRGKQYGTHRKETRKGFTKSVNQLMTEYRETLLPIDRLFMDEFEDLFLGVY